MADRMDNIIVEATPEIIRTLSNLALHTRGLMMSLEKTMRSELGRYSHKMHIKMAEEMIGVLTSNLEKVHVMFKLTP